MIIRNRVIETLKASPLNSRRSERPADKNGRYPPIILSGCTAVPSAIER